MEDIENPFENLKQYLGGGLQELSNTPIKLRKTLAQIEEDKAKLLAKNYALAIEARSALDDSLPLVGRLETCIKDEVNKNIEISESELKRIRQSWNEMDGKKFQLIKIRQHFDHLQDLCDLPKLASALISLQNFQGGLEILRRVRRLLNSYNEAKGSESDDCLLEMINSGVEFELKKMVNEIIRRLKEPLLKLPDCIQLLDYLTQTGWFTPQCLQYVFLSCRVASFEARLNARPEVKPGMKSSANSGTEDPGRQLKRRLDLTLNFATELAYFYRACFPHSADLTGLPIGTEVDRSLYYSALHVKVVRPLLEHFKEKISLVTQPSLISSLLNHTMLVGASLANIGLDIRQLFAPLFERRILDVFSIHFITASKNVRQSFRSAPRVRQVLASVSNNVPKPVVASPGPDYLPLLTRLTNQDFSPPLELKHFPPLAQYVNEMLHHFNSLRTLAVLNLARPLLSLLLKCLKEVGNLLLSIKPADDPHRNSEFDSWVYVMHTLFLDTLLPYLGSIMVLAIFGGTHVFTSKDEPEPNGRLLEELFQVQEFRNLFYQQLPATRKD